MAPLIHALHITMDPRKEMDEAIKEPEHMPLSYLLNMLRTNKTYTWARMENAVNAVNEVINPKPYLSDTLYITLKLMRSEGWTFSIDECDGQKILYLMYKESPGCRMPGSVTWSEGAPRELLDDRGAVLTHDDDGYVVYIPGMKKALLHTQFYNGTENTFGQGKTLTEAVCNFIKRGTLLEKVMARVQRKRDGSLINVRCLRKNGKLTVVSLTTNRAVRPHPRFMRSLYEKLYNKKCDFGWPNDRVRKDVISKLEEVVNSSPLFVACKTASLSFELCDADMTSLEPSCLYVNQINLDKECWDAEKEEFEKLFIEAGVRMGIDPVDLRDFGEVVDGTKTFEEFCEVSRAMRDAWLCDLKKWSVPEWESKAKQERYAEEVAKMEASDPMSWFVEGVVVTWLSDRNIDLALKWKTTMFKLLNKATFGTNMSAAYSRKVIADFINGAYYGVTSDEKTVEFFKNFLSKLEKADHRQDDFQQDVGKALDELRGHLAKAVVLSIDGEELPPIDMGNVTNAAKVLSETTLGEIAKTDYSLLARFQSNVFKVDANGKEAEKNDKTAVSVVPEAVINGKTVRLVSKQGVSASALLHMDGNKSTKKAAIFRAAAVITEKATSAVDFVRLMNALGACFDTEDETIDVPEDDQFVSEKQIEFAIEACAGHKTVILDFDGTLMIGGCNTGGAYGSEWARGKEPSEVSKLICKMYPDHKIIILTGASLGVSESFLYERGEFAIGTAVDAVVQVSGSQGLKTKVIKQLIDAGVLVEALFDDNLQVMKRAREEFGMKFTRYPVNREGRLGDVLEKATYIAKMFVMFGVCGMGKTYFVEMLQREFGRDIADIIAINLDKMKLEGVAEGAKERNLEEGLRVIRMLDNNPQLASIASMIIVDTMGLQGDQKRGDKVHVMPITKDLYDALPADVQAMMGTHIKDESMMRFASAIIELVGAPASAKGAKGAKGANAKGAKGAKSDGEKSCENACEKKVLGGIVYRIFQRDEKKATISTVTADNQAQVLPVRWETWKSILAISAGGKWGIKEAIPFVACDQHPSFKGAMYAMFELAKKNTTDLANMPHYLSISVDKAQAGFDGAHVTVCRHPTQDQVVASREHMLKTYGFKVSRVMQHVDKEDPNAPKYVWAELKCDDGMTAVLDKFDKKNPHMTISYGKGNPGLINKFMDEMKGEEVVHVLKNQRLEGVFYMH